MRDWYSLCKPILFQLSPERAQATALQLLKWAPSFTLPKIPDDPVTLMGLSFRNRIGIAAGLDDNGDYIDALGRLGVGFIEIGGVTPYPQSGNPFPRVFRLVNQSSLINRKGFANKGVDYAVACLKKRRYSGIVGVNVCKMKNTPLNSAVLDYQLCYRKLHPVADFVTINISSPNTPELRQLQTAAYLQDLLHAMKELQLALQQASSRYVPLLVKISPDLQAKDVAQLVENIITANMDAIIATNTSLSRAGVENNVQATQAGGLSGQGLLALSRQITQQVLQQAAGRIPVIGVGGIMNAEEAHYRFNLGVDFIQVYSGLIYGGLKWLEDIPIIDRRS